MDRRALLARLESAPHNVRFADMVALMEALGFRCLRVRGSHHIFKHPDVVELVSLQSVGGDAKPYQIRQVLKLAKAYHLMPEEDQ